MLKQLQKRIRALEARVIRGEIILTMADGRVIRMINRDPLQLLIKVLRSQVDESAEVRMLMEAVSVVESNGTHFAELARAIALSPVE